MGTFLAAGEIMARAVRRKSPKQATNLTVDSALLRAARASNVNLSAALEEALVAKVAAARRETWLRENTEAIAAYNDLVEEQGVFSEGSRSF